MPYDGECSGLHDLRTGLSTSEWLQLRQDTRNQDRKGRDEDRPVRRREAGRPTPLLRTGLSALELLSHRQSSQLAQRDAKILLEVAFPTVEDNIGFILFNTVRAKALVRALALTGNTEARA